MKPFLFVALFLSLIAPGHLAKAEQVEASTSPVRIGRIVIYRNQVFSDPKYVAHFPYSWANKIHVVTKESFIRQELLFKEGDPLDMTVIRESERVLRARPIFRYVKIEPQPAHDGVSDVVVKTEDVWTTNAQLDYGTAGGQNYYQVGALEHNFLGGGRSVGAFLKQDIDRTIKGISFQDPHFLGTSAQLSTGYGRDQKGKEWEIGLDRPYRSIFTTNSEAILFGASEDEDRLFVNGDEVATFHHDVFRERLFASRALNPDLDRSHRISVAHELQRDRFRDYRFSLPLEQPQNRKVSALMLGYSYQQYRFVKERGILTFDRDEDINLGLQASAEAGPSTKALGASTDGALGRAKVAKAWPINHGNNLLFLDTSADGRLEHTQMRNGLWRLHQQLMAPRWHDDNTLALRSEMTFSHNLDPESQALLGGENGLRGYSVRQFSGADKALVSLENRQVVLYDWLDLVSFGWAAFADWGGVWGRGTPLSLDRFRSDVGLGIRLAPSRSIDPSLIRMDVAYALSDNRSRSRFVINIGADLNLRFGDHKARKFDQ